MIKIESYFFQLSISIIKNNFIIFNILGIAPSQSITIISIHLFQELTQEEESLYCPY